MSRDLFGRRVSAISLVLLAILFQISFGRSAPDLEWTQTQQAPRPFPPPRYIPDHDFDTRHIALDLHFDWEQEQLIGMERMVFKPLLKDLRSIEIDAANMTITSVRLVGGGPLQYELDVPKEKLRIALGRSFQPSDEVTVLIEYHTNGPQTGRARSAGGGLRFIKPTEDDPKRPRQIWSQGESEYNHFWFPVYDHPNDFFTSEITATVERPLQVVSNGKLLDTKENIDGTRTFHWKIEQPHASYLSSIIVGEYTPIINDYEGIPIITNVYPGELAEGRITAARLPEMVKFFSEKTGLKYPYAKYAQTTVRDFGGGMENISATTQTDSMIHDARTELDQTSDGLQSHELAHQWFGDYLTCRSWADIWLNESFATYFQALWDEHKLGSDDFLYSDVKSNQDASFNTWKQGNRRPIVTKNYVGPDAVFDAYAYPRGGAVLHMLRTTLGEENWWRAINYYLRKYANQPVETEQFRIAIEESTGQSMDWFFDEWLYKMGHPIFRVTQNYDPAAKSLKLTIEQLQTIDPASQFPQVGMFQTPVEIEIGTASGTRVERVQILPQKEQSFTFSADSTPLLVNFDYRGTLIKELQFDKTTDVLEYQLNRDTDVLGRVWALQQLSLRMNMETSTEAEKKQITSEIGKAVVGDKFWGVRLEAAIALASSKDSGSRDALISATKDPNARVRARAVTSLASTKDSSLAGLYQQFLSDPSYAVVRAAASALGETKSPVAYEALTKLLEVSSWRDNIKASALSGLRALQDSRAADIAFRYAEKGNLPQVRAAALRLLGSIGKDNPKSFSIISETLSKAVQRGDMTLGLASAEALVTLGDARGLAAFEEVMQSTSTNQQVVDMITGFRDRLQKATVGAANPVVTKP